MKVLEYPVALVLKMWHMVFTHLFGIEATTAWVLAVPLLVITLRALLLPTVHRQYKSTRLLANLRPELRVITEEFKGRKDRESQREERRRVKETHREGNYRMSDGCLPMFIQMPVFIGLYRLLLRVSNPQEGLSASHSGIGPLTSADIDSFLHARFLNIPLSAYHAMSDAQLSYVGTTQQEILKIALPLIACASIFTTANFGYSMLRNFRTLDYSQRMSRIVIRLMWLAAPFVALFPWFFGLTGPAPLAILIYWVCNNLWTAVQVVVIQRRLDKTHPYSEAFLRDWRTQKNTYLDSKHEKRLKRRNRRRSLVGLDPIEKKRRGLHRA